MNRPRGLAAGSARCRLAAARPLGRSALLNHTSGLPTRRSDASTHTSDTRVRLDSLVQLYRLRDVAPSCLSMHMLARSCRYSATGKSCAAREGERARELVGVPPSGRTRAS
jgi:hypothetical protein